MSGSDNNPGAPTGFSNALHHAANNPNQPLPGTLNAIANPDALLIDIMEPAIAAAEFNSVPFQVAPFRDIPSVIIGHLAVPDFSAPEPDWRALVQYFKSSRAAAGLGNLQDLYVFVTRLALPSAIITNRRRLLDMYLAHRTVNMPIHCKLRYDSWPGPPFSPIPQIHPPIPALGVPPRPIFVSRQTPDSAKFVQWLHTVPNTPPPHHPAPYQLRHRPSEVDRYLDEPEMEIRQMHPDRLLIRTAWVLRLFWWIGCNNVKLEGYKQSGWNGIQAEF